MKILGMLSRADRDGLLNTANVINGLPVTGCNDLARFLSHIAQTTTATADMLSTALALATKVRLELSATSSPDAWLDAVQGLAYSADLAADLADERRRQAQKVTESIRIMQSVLAPQTTTV